VANFDKGDNFKNTVFDVKLSKTIKKTQKTLLAIFEFRVR